MLDSMHRLRLKDFVCVEELRAFRILNFDSGDSDHSHQCSLFTIKKNDSYICNWQQEKKSDSK